MSRSLMLAVLMAIVATIWVLSGSLTGSTREPPETDDGNSESASAVDADLFKVKAEHR